MNPKLQGSLLLVTVLPVEEAEKLCGKRHVHAHDKGMKAGDIEGSGEVQLETRLQVAPGTLVMGRGASFF